MIDTDQLHTLSATVGDIRRAVLNDSSLNPQERLSLILQLEQATQRVSDMTPLKSLPAYVLTGGVLGALIAKYLGAGVAGMLIGALAGAGLGGIFAPRPANPTPGFRSLLGT